MQKVDGVQSVKVSLKDGLTILDLKPDNTVTLAKLRQVIKNNGFVPKEAQIVARGSATMADGHPVFDVSGSRERLVLAAPGRQTGDDWQLSVASPSK
jgi:copper chaperone CopZ